MSDRERKASGRKRRRRFRDRSNEQPRGAPAPGGKAPSGGRRADRDRDARKGRGGGGKRGPREREPRLQYKSVILVPEEQAAECPICGKRVRDAVAALAYGEEHVPAHFDCVLEKLKGGRQLREGEQLCYLGGGSFGVVRFARGEGNTPFTISERIPFEPFPERPPWRRELDSVSRRPG